MLVLEGVVLQFGAEEALVDREELEEHFDEVVGGIDVLVFKIVVLPVGAEEVLIDGEELEENSDDFEV